MIETNEQNQAKQQKLFLEVTSEDLTMLVDALRAHKPRGKSAAEVLTRVLFQSKGDSPSLEEIENGSKELERSQHQAELIKSDLMKRLLTLKVSESAQ